MAESISNEERIKQLEADLAAANQRANVAEAQFAQGSDRRAGEDKPVVSATRNKPTWPFNVSLVGMPKLEVNSPPHPKVPDTNITAVDESEAIRQFCLMHRDEHGKQLDPTRYSFRAVCLQENARKQQAINKVNNRRLVSQGNLQVLTREEEFQTPEQNAKRQKMSLAS